MGVQTGEARRRRGATGVLRAPRVRPGWGLRSGAAESQKRSGCLVRERSASRSPSDPAY